MRQFCIYKGINQQDFVVVDGHFLNSADLDRFCRITQILEQQRIIKFSQ